MNNKKLIDKYSNPKLVQEYSNKWNYGKVYISDNPKKKYYVINPNTNKKIYFGTMHPPMEDWTKHQDEQRRQRYLKRATNIKGKWRDNPYSSNNLAIHLLWGGNIFHNLTKRIKSSVNAFLHGRDNYQPSVRHLLKEHGDEIIVNMTINRNPIKNIETFFNVISLGDFQERLNKTPYDKLYHLGLYISTEKNNNFVIEKNEVINVKQNQKIPPNSEQISINNPPHISIIDLLNNTQQVMGNKFFPYNAFNNNCQDFLINILHSNGIHNNTYDDFIKQEVKNLIKDKPIIRKFINSLTDLGSRVNILTQGLGIHNSYKVQAVLFPLEWTSEDCRKWLKSHNMKPIKRQHKTDQYRRYRIREPIINGQYITKHLRNGVVLIIQR